MDSEQATGDGTMGAALSLSLGHFSQSLDALRATCTVLERKCTDLNWALERANRELRESLAERERLASRLDGILRCMSAGVVAVDLAGRVTEINQAAETITGHSRESVLGRPYHEFVGRGVEERSGPLGAMDGGAALEREEKMILTAEGESLPVSYSTSVVRGVAGEVLGAVEVFHDLRRAKAMEEELLRTHALAAAGEMAAEAARQIRNPLAGVSGFAELLAREVTGDERCSLLVRRVREGVAGMEAAVERLLENARTVPVEFRSLDLVPVLEGVLDLFEGSLEDGAPTVVERRLRPPPGKVRLNPEQLRQALWNLLVNAREAMPEGGRVAVRIETDTPTGRARSACHAFVTVRVTDTGTGMGPDVAANAFDPFFTTRPDHVGLGLTSVRRIVTAHGGEVSLTTEPGRGTSVSFRLPLQPELRSAARDGRAS